MQKLLKNLVPGLALAATLVTPSSASAGFSIFFSHGWQGHGHHGKRHHRHRNHDWYRYRRHYGHNGPWPWYKPYDNVYHPPHAHGPRHRHGHRHGHGYAHGHRGKFGHKHGFRSKRQHDTAYHDDGRRRSGKAAARLAAVDPGKNKARNKRHTTSVRLRKTTTGDQTYKQASVEHKVIRSIPQTRLLEQVRGHVPGATLEEIAAARAGELTRRAGHIREALHEFQAEDWGD